MFCLRAVKLVTPGQTFHPEHAFPGLPSMAPTDARVDLELLMQLPSDEQRVAMHKELRARQPRVYQLLQSPGMDADGEAQAPCGGYGSTGIAAVRAGA